MLTLGVNSFPSLPKTEKWEQTQPVLLMQPRTTFSKTTPFCLRGVFAPTADMARQVYLFLSLDRPISDTNR